MCTVSGIVTLCKLPYRAPIESGLKSALNQCTALYGSLQSVTITDTVHIRSTILVPPEDEHIDARNMLRSVV